MKKAKISFILTLLAAFFTVSLLNAQTFHEEWVYDIKCDWGLWVWCLEEPVEGTVVYNVVYRLDKEGNVKGFHANLKGGKITGCTTGTVYKIRNSWNDGGKLNKNNDQQVWNYVDKMQIVAPGGEKYRVVFKGKLTVNANGEITKDFYFESMCE
jgi:hypothetical protein